MKFSKHRKKTYFSFSVQHENELHMGACFSPEKNCLFEKIANDNSDSGTEIKQFEFEDNDSDIIVNDLTSVKSTDLSFTHKLL